MSFVRFTIVWLTLVSSGLLVIYFIPSEAAKAVMAIAFFIGSAVLFVHEVKFSREQEVQKKKKGGRP